VNTRVRPLAFVLVCLCCGGRAVRHESGDGSGGMPAAANDCLVALRIDACCDEPVLVKSSELASDPCVIAWTGRRSVPDDVRATCKARTMGCENVKCTTPPVPSRVAAPAADGSCAFADECESDRGCDLARDGSEFCGCEQAHSIAEIEADGCLYSAINHTVEDCVVPICGAAAPCPTCPNCESSLPASCEVGMLGLRVCGPPFDGFRPL
jgi:hypothetical protein